jgi:hypothetical protein
MRVGDFQNGALGEPSDRFLKQLLGEVEKQTIRLVVDELLLRLGARLACPSNFSPDKVGALLREMILFVLLQAAIVVNTGHFMIVDESFNQYGALSVSLLGLYQIDQLNHLLESILPLLEFGDWCEQYLHVCISSRC